MTVVAGDTTTEVKVTTPPPAKAASEGDASRHSDDSDDDIGKGWDENTRKHVSQLRKEAKQNRLEAKEAKERAERLEASMNEITGNLKKITGGGDDDEIPPAQKVQMLSQQLQDRDDHIQFVESALSLGITDPKDRKYFQYLLDEHMDEHADDEDYELADEALDAIVAEVKARSGSAGSNLGPGGSTSFTSKNSPGHKQPSGGETTLEQFQAMSLVEKGELYGKHPDLYNKLMGQFKARK